jgi:hypothetical protein
MKRPRLKLSEHGRELLDLWPTFLGVLVVVLAVIVLAFLLLN